MRVTNPLDSSLPAGAQTPIGFPYDIAFVDTESSDAVRGQIEEYLARLTHFYDRITYARVNVRIPHKHGGVRLFHIHIELDVPGRRLAATREPEVTDKHVDVRSAIRDAFHKMQRQLEDFVKQRNDKKGAGRHH